MYIYIYTYIYIYIYVYVYIYIPGIHTLPPTGTVPRRPVAGTGRRGGGAVPYTSLAGVPPVFTRYPPPVLCLTGPSLARGVAAAAPCRGTCRT